MGLALFALSGVVAEEYVRPKLAKLKYDVQIDEDDDPLSRIGLITTIVIITILTVVVCTCCAMAFSAMIHA